MVTKRNKKIPSDLHWFDKGGKYEVALGELRFYDQGGYHTRVPVYIHDKKTRTVIERVGEGKQIGNFHPVWVNWKGKRVTVEEILQW